MTRSKLEFAKMLARLRFPSETPEKIQEISEQYAADMTLRKLCYEIEKAEEAAKPKKTKSLWSMITLEGSDDE